MSPYEISILSYEATNLIDSTFETWMAITFAFIVASHAAGDSLKTSLKIFISILYLSCATLLYFRYVSFATQVFTYFSELASYDIHTITATRASVLGLVRRLVMIFGTIGVVVFLFIPTRVSKEKR